MVSTFKTADTVFIGCFITYPIQSTAIYQKLLSVKPQASVRHSQRAVIILLRINCTQRVIQQQQWNHGNSWTNRIPRIPPPTQGSFSARRWRHSSWNPYACALTRQGSEHVQWLHSPHRRFPSPAIINQTAGRHSDHRAVILINTSRGRRRQLAPDEINLESHYGAHGRWYFKQQYNYVQSCPSWKLITWWCDNKLTRPKWPNSGFIVPLIFIWGNFTHCFGSSIEFPRKQ